MLDRSAAAVRSAASIGPRSLCRANPPAHMTCSTLDLARGFILMIRNGGGYRRVNGELTWASKHMDSNALDVEA